MLEPSLHIKNPHPPLGSGTMVRIVLLLFFSLKCMCVSYFAVTIARKVQSMKPVQNCTDFILSTFHAAEHLKLV